jgi:hypothetical protein
MFGGRLQHHRHQTTFIFIIIPTAVIALCVALSYLLHDAEGTLEFMDSLPTPVIIGVFGFFSALVAPQIQEYFNYKKQQRKVRKEMVMHSGPLLQAAEELQLRLFGVTDNNWGQVFRNKSKDEDKYIFVTSTMFLIAQYFAFAVLIKKSCPTLLAHDVGRKKLTSVSGEITSGGWVAIIQTIHLMEFEWASDCIAFTDICNDKLEESHGQEMREEQRQFQFLREEQNALAYHMIKEKDGKATCINFLEFLELMQTRGFAQSFERLCKQRNPSYDVLHKLKDFVVLWEAIAPGGGPFSRATSAVSSSPPCSTGLWITAVRHDLRTKVPRRHSGVHGTSLERRQRQWRRVDGTSLMCRFEFCDLLGDHLP